MWLVMYIDSSTYSFQCCMKSVCVCGCVGVCGCVCGCVCVCVGVCGCVGVCVGGGGLFMYAHTYVRMCLCVHVWKLLSVHV